MFEQGQKVYLETGFGVHSVVTIDRVTKTQAIVNRVRFNRANGREIANRLHTRRKSILPITPVITEQLEQNAKNHQQNLADEQAKQEQHQAKIAKLRREQMELFVQHVPSPDVTTQVMSDGARIYTVVLPSNPKRPEIQYTFAIVCCKTKQEMNFRTGQMEPEVTVSYSWLTNQGSGFSSSGGTYIKPTEEADTLRQILCDIWFRH